ncbi:hypothetical protein [Actinomadura sp. HBU206391]|uniref:hypothetical protein n=1 Tax=Actinomadura sp. HBU206391 TaxID=2731692 RepID=UPI0016500777|nr:hypothetical protein [Actinomadura sp. HBU206391]MBC6458126.1 hypothetical protein [Actinomadura sp. HBU206391]
MTVSAALMPARYGLSGKAPALKRHPAERRLATMLAAVRQLEGRAVDDALEVLFEATEFGENITVEQLWKSIEAVVAVGAPRRD